MTQLTVFTIKTLQKLGKFHRLLPALLLCLIAIPASAQTIACGLYNWIAPEVTSAVVIGSVVIFLLAIFAAIIKIVSPQALPFGNSVIGTLFAIAFVLVIYVNHIAILTWAGQLGGGTLDISTAITSCATATGT